MCFKDLVKKASNGISKHSPEILIGLGIAGLVSTTVMAVKATPKALVLIEEAKRDKRDAGEEPELTIVETVKTTWKCYIPTVLSAGVSIACILGSRSINAKRNAALATAYRVTEATLSEYKDKIVEVVGEKKANQIKEHVAQSMVDKNPVSDKEVLVFDDSDDILMYDPWSSRYFKSTRNKVEKAVNRINEYMIGETYCCLNDFYSEIGLPPTNAGERLGFNISIYGTMDVTFYTTVAKNGDPCLALDFHTEPQYDFDRAY